MKTIWPLIQFLPLTIFIGVARSHGFAGEAWPLAFKWGALTALLELIVLLPILGNRISRLISGANLFLIFGGTGFFFNISLFISLIDYLRTSAVFFFLILVCAGATLTTTTGVFEKAISKSGAEKRFSIYFLLGIFIVFIWSLYHRDDVMTGGTLPFISLILLKRFLQSRLNNI